MLKYLFKVKEKKIQFSQKKVYMQHFLLREVKKKYKLCLVQHYN